MTDQELIEHASKQVQALQMALDMIECEKYERRHVRWAIIDALKEEPAAPAQPAPWVGLTDKEVGAAYDFANANSQYGHHHFGFWLDSYRAIEAKLRERNGAAQPAPVQEPVAWIDCKVKMPPAGVRVFFLHKDYDRVGFDTWFGDDFRWTPSHWMPIPQLTTTQPTAQPAKQCPPCNHDCNQGDTCPARK